LRLVAAEAVGEDAGVGDGLVVSLLSGRSA
jgi:hypothetical protein